MDDNFLLDGPFGVQGDPTVVENNYKNWEDGEYQTKGIHSFISKDKDRDVSIFVAQSDQMVARFKVLLLQKDLETQNVIEVEGPAMSATASQLRMLVRAHGGNVENLPKESTTMFLMAVQAECKKGNKVQTCYVKGGWVKRISGMNPPIGKDLFAWRFDGFWAKDAPTPIAFVKDQFGNDTVNAKFVVVADGWGNPSIYEGYEISVGVYNPFTGDSVLVGGSKRPATQIGERGGIPMNVKRFVQFINTFASAEFANHVWEEDVEKSSLGINEIANPLPVVAKYLKGSTRLAVAALSAKSKGAHVGDPKLNLDDLVPYQGKELNLDIRAEEETRQPSELEVFVRKAEAVAGISIFKPTAKNSNEINLEFTPEGLDWAKKTLADAWDKLELPKDNGRRQIGSLDAIQLKALTNSLETDGIDSF